MSPATKRHAPRFTPAQKRENRSADAIAAAVASYADLLDLGPSLERLQRVVSTHAALATSELLEAVRFEGQLDRGAR